MNASAFVDGGVGTVVRFTLSAVPTLIPTTDLALLSATNFVDLASTVLYIINIFICVGVSSIFSVDVDVLLAAGRADANVAAERVDCGYGIFNFIV